MLKRIQLALTTALVVRSGIVIVQTSPGTPAAPGDGSGRAVNSAAGSGLDWLGIIVVLAVIAAAIW